MTDDTRLGGPTTVGARSPMRPLADGTIRSRVEAALAWEPGLRAGAVNVSVEDAVITLRGVMPTFAQKQAAERVSRSVCGVADVSNALGVRLAIAHTRSDEDLESAVVAALRWSASLPAHRIGVGVKNGVVTLRGTVACQREKDAASRLVEDLIGVRDVANEIVVAPDRDAGNLIPAIEAALWRAAVVDPRQIRVRAADGCVVLTGQVRSWAEREEAERQAWAAPGVRQVDDQIRVLPVERRERE
ncbi:MAG: BON domain-containing protein [Gemmatimonadetes bacterium]|nr:BON domain-containing protein [Gemmatimonadota bacterium]